MSRTVLLVEDDKALNGDAFTIMLTKMATRSAPAFDGQQALDLLKTVQPDIILLDLLMPVLEAAKNFAAV